jgi:hypothetical protein
MLRIFLPIEKLRIACYKKGANGLVGMLRKFRQIDYNRCKKLPFNEFRRGLLGTIIENDMVYIDL